MVTRAGIELNLDTLYYSFSTFQRAIKSSTLSITRSYCFHFGAKLWYFPHFPSLLQFAQERGIFFFMNL